MTVPDDTPEIRPELPGDIAQIHAVQSAAFETDGEARLVAALRQACPELISLVALLDGSVVGHILFSPVTLEGAIPEPRVMGLAPVAVLPDFQRQGIGEQLCRAGLDACRDAHWEGAVVLGHADYYPRFGFVPSVQFGFKSTYPVPDDVFMALEIAPGAFRGCTGAVARYHSVFHDL